MESSFSIQLLKNRIRRNIKRRCSLAKQISFQLDAKPVSRKALLRAAGMGMFWLFVLCFVPSMTGGSAHASDVTAIKSKAKQGDARAQYLLGRIYETGEGVRENFVKAAKWYRKAAEQNSVQAQYRLGRLYASGLGVRQSYAEAIQCFRKAAAQGHIPAKNRLGVMYERGEGVEQDVVEAYKWFTLAAADNQHLFGVANREVLARRLTAEQMAEGDRRAAVLVTITSSEEGL